MVYSVEKARIPANALNDVHAAMADPKSVLQHIRLDAAVAMNMLEIPGAIFPTFQTG